MSESNDDLEHLLEQKAALFDPRPGFVAAGRARLKAGLGPQPPRSLWSIFQRNPASLSYAGRPAFQSFLAPHPRLTAALLVLTILMAFLSGNVIGRAAPTWLPGDWFYPLKVRMEYARLALSPTQPQQAQAHIDFAQRRLLEAQALAFEGRYDEVPDALFRFNNQVDLAVLRIDALAHTQPQEAARLAGALQTSIQNQSSLVQVLAQLSPEPARSRFIRALSVAQTSLWAIQDLIDPRSQG